MAAFPESHANIAYKQATTGKAGKKYCKVVGCCADLSLCDKYCQKKHICRQHLKADAVCCKDGGHILWRFCQQCGKLEPLSKFEGVKRSCRASLEKRRMASDHDECGKHHNHTPRRKQTPATQQTKAVHAVAVAATGDNGVPAPVTCSSGSEVTAAAAVSTDAAAAAAALAEVYCRDLQEQQQQGSDIGSGSSMDCSEEVLSKIMTEIFNCNPASELYSDASIINTSNTSNDNSITTLELMIEQELLAAAQLQQQQCNAAAAAAAASGSLLGTQQPQHVMHNALTAAYMPDAAPHSHYNWFTPAATTAAAPFSRADLDLQMRLQHLTHQMAELHRMLAAMHQSQQLHHRPMSPAAGAAMPAWLQSVGAAAAFSNGPVTIHPAVMPAWRQGVGAMLPMLPANWQMYGAHCC